MCCIIGIYKIVYILLSLKDKGRGIFMKKYKVVDLLDGNKEIVGYADSLSEVKKLAKKWLDEVTEEAAIYYYPFNEEKGQYEISKRIFLKSC